MAQEEIHSVTGRAVYVPGDDIDTDRIIPARFMKCVTFDGLGDYYFNDVRFNEDGSKRKHNLNDERFAGATILISGNNFGCGSSREHAPQAIRRAGYNGIIAGSFAEIFFGNSTQLGMPCVAVSDEDREKLVAAVANDPARPLTIDLDELVVRFGDEAVPCEIREGAREALRNGHWDPLDDLVSAAAEVDAAAARLPYMAQA